MTLELTDEDRRLLEGEGGETKRIAMRVIVRMAEVQGASRLIDVQRAHIDGCIYTGPASLQFADTLAELGGEVSIPTTLNAISVDLARWRDQGVDPEWAGYATRLANAYIRMGARPTFTCAPYQLADRPKLGEHIAWAESNAVVYANSVLGARTNRYGDLMDICAALTGRVPLSGLHMEENRLGTVAIRLPKLGPMDASFYPTLGYWVGGRVGSRVPVIIGLEDTPSADDLKAFGAAAATAGSVGMFHIVGVTPEAPTEEAAFGHQPPLESWTVDREELAEVWEKLSSARSREVDVIAVGSPHFSLEECAKLAHLIQTNGGTARIPFLITTSQHVYNEALHKGWVEIIEQFGAQLITDTCLCMINTPIIPADSRTLMTNSAKYAHYAPGLINRNILYGSLEDCVNSAIAGVPTITEPK